MGAGPTRMTGGAKSFATLITGGDAAGQADDWAAAAGAAKGAAADPEPAEDDAAEKSDSATPAPSTLAGWGRGGVGLHLQLGRAKNPDIVS